MIGLIINFRKLCFKRRRGFGIVETILMIVVVAFTVGAILQTSFVTSSMQIAGRRYVESQKSMVSFFHTVESISAEDIIADSVREAVKNINLVENENFPDIIKNIEVISNDRVVDVRIVLADSDMKERVIISTYNVFSNKTVSDDRMITGSRDKSRG